MESIIIVYYTEIHYATEFNPGRDSLILLLVFNVKQKDLLQNFLKMSKLLFTLNACCMKVRKGIDHMHEDLVNVDLAI